MTVSPLPSSSPGVFPWGYVFQRGDLPIYITDPAGNPSSPAVITYTLFYYPKGSGCAFQAGPSNRTPVTAGVGSYYVSGVSGECGQPGRWFVQWNWQETIDSPAHQDIFGFVVFDSATGFKPAQPCCTKFPRCNCGCSGTPPKIGWF